VLTPVEAAHGRANNAFYTGGVDRASIVFNPGARNPPARARLVAAAAVWRLRGWEIDVVDTEASGHGAHLAREAALSGSKVVFACGGDGTINEVVNGIVGTPATLGVLRAGMGNVFAKEVGVPRSIDRALGVLATGHDYAFDAGYAAGENVPSAPPWLPGDQRLFLLMAGVGFDGRVVSRVPAEQKRRLGTASYVLWGAAEALRFKSRKVAMTFDGTGVEADLFWLLLANTRSYGGVADIATDAVADDGLLQACLFSGEGLIWLAAMSARIALKRHRSAKGVSCLTAANVEVSTSGLAVQADGEYFGETPMRFGVLKQAVKVRLFPGAADRLLRNQPESGSS